LTAALAALALVAAAVAAGVAARGADAASVTSCTDFLAPGTYQRVVVPAGESCFSDGGVTIRSGLFVQDGATFVLGSEEAPETTAPSAAASTRRTPRTCRSTS
jgi:hypothetical protein